MIKNIIVLFVYILLFFINYIIVASLYYRYIIKITIKINDILNKCPKCNSRKIRVPINPLNNKCKCDKCGKKFKIKD